MTDERLQKPSLKFSENRGQTCKNHHSTNQQDSNNEYVNEWTFRKHVSDKDNPTQNLSDINQSQILAILWKNLYRAIPAVPTNIAASIATITTTKAPKSTLGNRLLAVSARLSPWKLRIMSEVYGMQTDKLNVGE